MVPSVWDMQEMGCEPGGSSLFQEGANPEKVQRCTGLEWSLGPVDVNGHDHLLQQDSWYTDTI